MADLPNVLFFFTDDQRFDTIRALGNEEIITPNLDQLIGRGTCYTHAHIPGGTCGAVCMPSRAMLLTGRTLFHIDREGQEIPAEHVTMGECFARSGYETFGTGKWHNGRPGYARSFTCGDEIFFGGMNDHWNVPAYHFDPTGRYETKCPLTLEWGYHNDLMYRDCDHVHAGKHSTDLFTEAATRFLKEREGGRPFFMYVALMAPHDPRTMPERFLRMYDPERIVLPENFAPEHAIDTGALRIRDELLAAFPRTPKEIKRHIAEYYAMITHLDNAFGRLMNVLEECGQSERTIIVLSGDNGLALGQHGLMGKQNLYDHSVRVPLVFAGPGVPRGERREALVYLLDVFPTLCELAGLETPRTVEGKSLVRSMNDSGEHVRQMLYLAYESSIRGVTDGRRKLIEYSCGASQMFDLEADAKETCNLLSEGKVTAEARQLRRALRDLSRAWDDEKHPKGAPFWKKRPDLATGN